MKNANTIGKRDFSRKTNQALAKKGVEIVGLQAIPDATGSFLNSETGYVLNDNGTSKIRTYLQVLAMAEVA